MHIRPLALGLACCVLLPHPAAAFCGFYVAGAEEPLYNDATMVVLLREGIHTVLSMRNDYRGPPENFAMVVPVPEVLNEADVRTLDPEVFERVDRLASPRLVEYWEQDPCAEGMDGNRIGASFGVGGLGLLGTGRGSGGSGVTVEAEFAVGEYEIVILSARDSSGLDTWLRDNEYQIPDGAEEALRPYVEAGTKFFVAKVDVSKVTFDEGRAMLSPLRIHYESENFSLPVRLGMLNSSGTQDLIVHILADNQRYEVANYPNVTVPTNLDVRDGVRARFSEMYAALFDATIERNPGSVVTEYSWQASGCDPCPGGISGLTPADLMTLGEDGSWEQAHAPSGLSYQVIAGAPRVQGDLPAKVVRRVARRHRHELRSCAESTARADVSPPGSYSVQISYLISREGAVSRVLVNGAGSEAFRACVTHAYRRWAFPTSSDGHTFVRERLQMRNTAGPARRGFGGLGRRSRTAKVLTRLHYRYSEGDLGEDLMFRAARPITGGRESGEELSQGASESTTNNFQARYAIRHEWTGPIECDEPARGRWGGPPVRETTPAEELEPGDLQGSSEALNALLAASLGQPSRPPLSAQDLAQAPRGNLLLAAQLAQAVPALALDDAALAAAREEQEPESPDETTTSETAEQHAYTPASSVEASGCGCRLGRSSPGGAAWLGLLGLVWLKRRRA